MKYLKNFNEELFNFFKKDGKKFEFDIVDRTMGKLEREYYNRIGNTIGDYLQDILDDYQVDVKNGYRSLKYPIITYCLRFKDLMPKSDLLSICEEIKLAVDRSSELLNVGLEIIHPHIGHGPDGGVKCTWRIDRVFNTRRFSIHNNFLIFQHSNQDGRPSSDIYFTILNPYYSEFNYDK
jgi:hypothetical protein